MQKTEIRLTNTKAQSNQLYAGYDTDLDLINITLPQHDLILAPQMAFELIFVLTSALGVRERNKK